MSAEVRDDIVAALIASLVDGRAHRDIVRQATPAEKLAAARRLAENALAADSGPADLLTLGYRDLVQLGVQGHSLLWLCDQLSPLWAGRPETALSDVLKTINPDRLDYLAAELCRGGVHALCRTEHGT